MADPFMPAQDSLALAKMQAFAAGISADPAKYFVSVADAANIDSAVDAFALAHATATNPATRTPGAVNDKDVARNIAEQLVRQFAVQIKYNAGISDTDKINIGVNPVNPDRQPIDVPGTSPVLSIIAATPGSHTVRFADSMTPASRAKPFGAAQIQIFVSIGEGPAINADEAEYYGAFSKNPVSVVFIENDDGKMATYFARWCGVKGDVGPWSVPVSMRIAA